jgi:DNA-binding transcriptional ArsR family regulator
VAREETKAQRSRGIEGRLHYSVGHRIRTEILAALNERSYTCAELRQILGQPLSTVTHHVEELLKASAIEIGKVEHVRNIERYYYRAVSVPFFSDEEMSTKTPEERHDIYGLILQASMAEAIASFWAGKITDDPRVVMAWNWFNVDSQGREEIATELAESWERLRSIEAAAVNRRADSGEESVSMIVTSLGYERSRSSPQPPFRLRKY